MGRDYRESPKKPKYKRKFGGKEYKYGYGYDSKAKANKAAERVRNKGGCARVLKGKITSKGRSRNDYRVYVRGRK